MLSFFFIIFSINIFSSLNILATQHEPNNTDLPLDLSMKGKKRVNDSVEGYKYDELDLKIKKLCTNTIMTTASANQKLLSTKSKKVFLNLIYHKSCKKEPAKPISRKNIQIADNIFTYTVPDVTLKLNLDFMDQDINDATSNKQMNKIDDLSIENLIDCFISVFCDLQSNVNTDTFKLKRVFEYLELMVPEFLPFLFYIRTIQSDLPKVSCINQFLKRIKRFDDNFSSWISKYYQLLNKEFISKNTRDKNLIIFFESLNVYQISLFLEFENLLVDFLELINADKNVIKNYRFLIKLHIHERITGRKYKLNLDINLFIYFIINTWDKNENYLEKFNKYNGIVDKENLNDKEMLYALKAIYLIVDSMIFKASIFQYNQMLQSFKIHPFIIGNHLAGFTGFENGRFTGFDFFYTKEDMKWRKRVNFLEFWKLLYLNFLSGVFDRQNID